MLCLEHRWLSLEVRVFPERQQDSVSPKASFSSRQSETLQDAQAVSHRAEMQGHWAIWPVLWALTSTTQSRPYTCHARLDPSPAWCSPQCLSIQAALLTVEASAARLYSLPLGAPKSMLFYWTIPFPFPEFLERVWRRSRCFSLKCSLHMEIKTFRKVLGTLIDWTRPAALRCPRSRKRCGASHLLLEAQTVCFQCQECLFVHCLPQLPLSLRIDLRQAGTARPDLAGLLHAEG